MPLGLGAALRRIAGAAGQIFACAAAALKLRDQVGRVVDIELLVEREEGDLAHAVALGQSETLCARDARGLHLVGPKRGQRLHGSVAAKSPQLLARLERLGLLRLGSRPPRPRSA